MPDLENSGKFALSESRRNSMPSTNHDAAAVLRLIKLIHTIIWSFFASCILLVPVFAWFARYRIASVFIAIVFAEILILAVNRWRCPLTDVAGRHTQDRRDNFDIYLPAWLARHNKIIFGTLYLAGILFTIARSWFWPH